MRDLRSNISAEAGARQTYEFLIKACDDEGTKKTLHHLLTREITHANMFMKALGQMGKLDDPFFGNIPPDETVKLVFNLSKVRTNGVLGMKSQTSNTSPEEGECSHQSGPGPQTCQGIPQDELAAIERKGPP